MRLFPPPFVPPGVDEILDALPDDADILAWRQPGLQQRVLQCLEAESNYKHTYKDAVHIVPVHTDKLHYYKFKGQRVFWLSPSRFNDGKTFPAFEAEAIAKRLAETKNTESKWFQSKPEETLGVWRQTAVDGRAKHAYMDMKIQQPDVEIPDQIPEASESPLDPKTYFKKVEPTPAFYRCLASILRRFVIWATEVTFYDEEWEIVGQADLILQDRATGLLIVADWKHCTTNDLGDVTKAYGKTGCHVSTVHLPATKLNKYLFQTSFYRKMAKRRTHGEWPPFAKRVILFNFNPHTPDLYEEYDRASLDLKLFFQRLPWRDHDPLHHDYTQLSTLVPRYEAGAHAPQQPTRTQRVSIRAGMWREPDVAWVGRQYPSAKARNEAYEGANAQILQALEQDNVSEALAIYAAYEEKCSRYNMRNSPFHHPWYWMSGKDPDPPGCNAYYEWWLLNNRKALLMLPEFVGKRIACWCKPEDKACHADILTRYVQAYERGDWRPDLSYETLFPPEQEEGEGAGDTSKPKRRKPKIPKQKAVAVIDDTPF